MAEMLEQRKHEAAIATHAAQAVQREREVGASLEETRARERDAVVSTPAARALVGAALLTYVGRESDTVNNNNKC